MAQKMNSSSKLVRLTQLRNMLLDCCRESAQDSDEWYMYHDMLTNVCDKLTDERRRLGYMAVYPKGHCCVHNAFFVGTLEQCKTYVDILQLTDPNIKEETIVSKL